MCSSGQWIWDRSMESVRRIPSRPTSRPSLRPMVAGAAGPETRHSVSRSGLSDGIEMELRPCYRLVAPLEPSGAIAGANEVGRACGGLVDSPRGHDPNGV